MANDKVVFEIVATAKGVKITQKQTDDLTKSTDRADKSTKKLSKTRDSYNRREKGAAGISSNSTKNFSKMQQSIDGGGGSGGLVRAYALLAANVFALSAAFGILSRSAQITTLTESMTQLEVVSGQSIRKVARDLQEASGFGLDFAESLRSTSLAMSAGFDTSTISELGEVARNAAVSLGRPMGDALDRIFRGVIKVEPELLDEIGLFVRVNEAAAKYASGLGLAAADLTEFQKRQAFATEALAQGTEKFGDFADIETDPYSKLAASFADMAQSILQTVGPAISFVVNLLAENKVLLGTVFAGIAFALMRLVVPAMSSFTVSLEANAMAAKSAAAAHTKAMDERIGQVKHVNLMEKEAALLNAKNAMAAKTNTEGYKGRGKALADANSQLANAGTSEEKITALINKREVLNKSIRKNTKAQITAEQAAIDDEIKDLKKIKKIEGEIKDIKNQPALKVKTGQKADLINTRLIQKEIRATGLAAVAASAETQGFTFAMRNLGATVTAASVSAKAAGVSFGFMQKSMLFAAGAAVALQTAMSRLMMVIAPYLAAFAFLAPLVVGLAKKFGFFSEESKKVKETTKAASEAMSVFGDTMKKARERMEGLNFTLAREGALAMSNEIAATSSALVEMADAALALANHWDDGAVFENIDGVMKNSITGAKAYTEEQMNTMEAFVEGLSSEANKGLVSMQIGGIIEEGRKSGKAVSEIVREINEVAPELLKAQNTLNSAVKGAKDSMATFRDQFIIKTDVDPVVASFRQMDAALSSAYLSAFDINNTFEELLNKDDESGLYTSPIAAMMSKEHLIMLEKIDKKTDEDGKKRRVVLKLTKQEFMEQQKALVMNKVQMGLLAKEEKIFANSIKNSNFMFQEGLDIRSKQRNLALELQKIASDNGANNLKLTNQRVAELATMKSIDEIMSQHDTKLLNQSQVLGAINEHLKTQQLIVENTLQGNLDSLKIEQQRATLALKSLELQDKLNKAKAVEANNALKLKSFGQTGRTALSGSNIVKAIQNEETARKKTAKSRESEEKIIASIKFKILDEEYKLLDAQKASALAALTRVSGTIADMNKRTKELMAKRFTPGGLSDEDKEELRGLITARNQAKIIQNERQLLKKDREDTSKNAADTAKLITQTFTNEGGAYVNKLLGALGKIKGASVGESSQTLSNSKGIIAEVAADPAMDNAEGRAAVAAAEINLVEESMLQMASNIQNTLGDDGILLSALATASAGFVDIGQNAKAAFDDAGTGMGKIAAVSAGAAAAIGQVMAVQAAAAKQATGEIDKMIEAEKKRDGKSKGSLAKIAAMEKRKDDIKRKSFNQNKKLMLAQAIMSTAASVSSALVGPPGLPWSAIMATMAAGLGMAQVKIIKGMTYQGGGSSGASVPSTIAVGKRNNKVDVAKSATAGETSYLRGGQGIGSNANNFRPAASGLKSYASGGEILVGERGPEVIAPLGPMSVTPNSKIGGGTSNVNFTINAVDAAGVEQLLSTQRGNIIGMIRQAANEHGEEFMETVDTGAYS